MARAQREALMDETVATAYDRLNAGDVDGFLALFADDAVFAIPGSTPSRDHDKTGFRRVPAEVVTATRIGQHKQELVGAYEGPCGGVARVFDTFAVVDGTRAKYLCARLDFAHQPRVRSGTWGSYCVKRNGIRCLRRSRSRPGGTSKEIPWAGETGAN